MNISSKLTRAIIGAIAMAALSTSVHAERERSGSWSTDRGGSGTYSGQSERTPASKTRSPARYLWVMLLARLFEPMPLSCPNCGADMRLIAFITAAAPIERILSHIGEPPRPPPITPTRGPPAWDDAPEPVADWDLLQQPEPDFEPL